MTSRCQGVGPNQSITLGPELLDIPIRFQFESATGWRPEDDPAEWARYTFGLAQLVWDAEAVFTELDAQPELFH